jgi:hypothetical protein
MAIRKNKKRIDPRYFLNETTYRDLDEEGRSEHDAEASGMVRSYEEGLAAGKAGDPPRLKGGEYMRGYKKGKEEGPGQEALEEKFSAGQRLLKHLGITKEDWDQWSREDQKDARKKFRYYLKQSGLGPTVLNKGDSTNLATGAVTRDGVTKERGTDAYDQYMKPDASGKTGPERGAEAAAAQTARDAARAKHNKEQPWYRNLPGKTPKE